MIVWVARLCACVCVFCLLRRICFGHLFFVHAASRSLPASAYHTRCQQDADDFCFPTKVYFFNIFIPRFRLCGGVEEEKSHGRNKIRREHVIVGDRHWIKQLRLVARFILM